MSKTAFPGHFPQTRWSLVLRSRARVAPDSEAHHALSELCSLYWFPLYGYARRRGHSPEQAEDLTQGFFERLLTQELFSKADQNKGRLRAFLLHTFQCFIAEQHRQATRIKRGGKEAAISFDELTAEARYRSEPADTNTPEVFFERAWFQSVLQESLQGLEEEYERRGQRPLFERLKAFLAWNEGGERLGEAARELNLSPGAARVAVHRLRQRFRHLIERRLADTLADPAEVQEELRQLIRVLTA